MGLVPEAYRGVFQEALAGLQSDVPPLDPDAVAAVVEAELGAPPSRLFTRFSTRPIAAASIGQVHAAETADGRELAVKVQYPGVADAIRSDLANTDLIAAFLNLGRTVLRDFAPNLDAKAVAEEIRERVGEELDYTVELANQQAFLERYRGHPSIHIPEVVPELSSARVLTMELVDGRQWAAALESDQSLRDQWGAVISRFVFDSLYRAGLFNADPHPGNYLFHEDGTVTFLDFGCVKRFTPDQLDAMRRASRAAFDDDAGALVAALRDVGALPPGKAIDPERIMAWYRPSWEPFLAPQPYTLTPEYAADVVARTFDPLGEWGDVVRGFAVPKDLVFLNRISLGLNSVLGALRATADWRAIADDYLC
jgi:predicted unusual protein kinase regulating ubiquinone biosynthesis (AarF/ABC1/UbiB family)